MSLDEEDVVVQVPPDGEVDVDAEVEVVAKEPKESSEPKENKVVTADAGVADFKRQLAETQQRASQEAAERRRLEAENITLRDQNAVVVQNSIATAAEAVKAEIDGLKKEHTTALEAGEYGTVSEIQEKMADAVARRREIEDAKTAPVERRAQPAAPDPVDAYIGQFSAASQAWLRDHKDCVTDPKMNNKMIGAHHRAVAEGYKPDSNEYFDFMEKDIGLKVDDAGEIEPEQRLQPQRRAAPSLAARPSRQPPAANGRQAPREVRLTADEVAVAKENGLTPAEYAREKVKLEDEGRIGKAANR